MKTKILSQGIVMRETEGDCKYFGWPSVIRLDDGRLMAAASGPRAEHVCPFGKNSIAYSSDNGETWSDYRIVTNSPLDDRDAGLVNMGNGKVAITWFTNSRAIQRHWTGWRDDAWKKRVNDYCDTVSDEDEARFLGSLIRISEDNGETWGDEIKVPVSTPHGFTVLKDGTYLYLGKENVELYQNVDPGFESATRRISAYASADGVNWEYRGSIPLPEYLKLGNCHEPHVIELNDGSLLGVIRIQENPDYKFYVFKSVSKDGGRTWDVMEPTNMAGSPPHLLRHSSGALICAYAERLGADSSERVGISLDEGKTWELFTLDDRSKSSDLGYPCTVECEDGSLVTVYYQREGDDISTSILYTKWTLEV